MSETIKLKEICSCGGVLEIETQRSPVLERVIAEWRSQHACPTPPPGPCGHVLEWAP